MLSKFLDPKNDVAFKKIFGTPKNKNILIHFINDMITFKEGNPITDVFFLKTNLDPDIAAQKTSLVDILCKDEKGNRYIVEMQVVKEKGFEKRAQYYASKVYCSQMNEGDEYDNLKEVIFLAISNVPLFKNKISYKSNHITLDSETYEHDLKDFSYVFLDLSKFHKNIDELSNMNEKWCYFFKHAWETSERDLKKIIGRDRIIGKAYEELNRYSWNEVELRTYEQSEKYEGVHRAQIAHSYDEGKADGKAEGLAEGKAEGLAQGKAEGEKKARSELLLLLLLQKFKKIEEPYSQKIQEASPALLKKWVERAFICSTIEDVFLKHE